ncbi:MAG: hypothetical protein NDJ89_06050 [Oligoflexia bacterium]|nr:hypothetical protein [Oligoflexia bacterium]
MENSKRLAVRLESGESVLPGELWLREWTRRERMLRALKFGGGSWGLALVSVFLPLLHFVLVPAFLIAGPLVAFFVFNQESLVLGGKGKCPHCGGDFSIRRGAPRFPISDLCTRCQRTVLVRAGD